MSGYITFRGGGPITYGCVRQGDTAQSSCQAESHSINKCVKDTLHLCHVADDLGLLTTPTALLVFGTTTKGLSIGLLATPIAKCVTLTCVKIWSEKMVPLDQEETIRPHVGGTV